MQQNNPPLENLFLANTSPLFGEGAQVETAQHLAQKSLGNRALQIMPMEGGSI
jgi:hypothetical protein